MSESGYPLFNPHEIHDACGTGFIAEVSGEPGRRVVTLALQALKRLKHRGALGADTQTGDGSGLLTDLPEPLFSRILEREYGVQLQPGEELAIAMVFTLPGEEPRFEKNLRTLASRHELTYIGKRKVPIDDQVLGEVARASCPLIFQYLFACPSESARPVESRLYLVRKAMEQVIAESGGASFICSFSSKTIVYKGLMVADQLDRFYLDLQDPEYIAKVALFHERYSTNTSPIWSLAQPFRLVAHNGEINTIKGNRLWMWARERELGSDFWRDDLDTLKPIVTAEASDSFSLDNTLEFLVRSGRTLSQGLMMMIPDPYANGLEMDRALKDFYVYHENVIEPWDGPAALVFTDGHQVGAKLDRNGLRPLRYTITRDGLVIMASEAGVIEVEAENLRHHRHMSAGEIFVLDLDGSGISTNDEIKAQVASEVSYSRLLGDHIRVIKRGSSQEEFGELGLPPGGLNPRLQLALGWDQEDLSRYVIPMARSGREPMGSMGDDTPPAFLSPRPRRFYDYCKHSFAQVTNPPIDPLRESFTTSLYQYLGSETNLLATKPRFDGAVRIESPILSPREVRQLEGYHSWLPHTKITCHVRNDGNLKARLAEIKQASEEAVLDGHKLLLVSDEGLTPEMLPIPMPLVVSALHHHLIGKKIRSKVSIICITGDMVEDHHLACLVTLGATAVYPYMAYELIREHFADEDWPERMSSYRYALEKGLLKIMTKSGISTCTSYHGSMLLHGIGFSQSLLDQYFPSITSSTGGIGLDQIMQDLLTRNTQAYAATQPRLRESGRFRYRKDGEPHGFAPAVFRAITDSAKSESALESRNGTAPVYLRDLLDVKTGHPFPIDQVDRAEGILSRFGSGAISFGAISEEAHRTLARGFNLAGGRSNTGEGGEQADRYAPTNPDKLVNCYVKQIASGRFGVTTDYLAAAKEIQIKIAQGAKPGEGGQLPGSKVSLSIAAVRNSTPGVPLISPPPHHDIYSIEDIAQLIYDLKQVNPWADVSVKLVSQPGVGTIASGVVKGGADIVLISGGDGGTGASPLGSLKHAGLPWELGLAETHQVLTANGLRPRVTLRVDGGLKDGRDIVIAALLGAEEFDFGTAALVALGCVMARQCHLNTCPAGIATHDAALKRRFKGTPEQLAKYLRQVASHVRQLLSEMGFRSLDEIIGRSDLLAANEVGRALTEKEQINLKPILNPEAHHGLPLREKVKGQQTAKAVSSGHFDDDVIPEARKAILTHRHVVIRRDIRNTDRAVGTKLSGQLAFMYGRGSFSGDIQLRLKGIAGQSFGAFLVNGVELRLRGIANDYVGKGMSGGLISIRFEKAIREMDPSQTIIGNVALYGATAGTLLVAGKAGERFAVRNSGAAAVVEGVGNHCCEYMTRGTVMVLGNFGWNFGAGMSGGVAYVYITDEEELDALNRDFVRPTTLKTRDVNLIQKLLRNHRFHTGSVIAHRILSNWESEKVHLVKVVSLAQDVLDFEEIYNQQVAARLGVMLSE
ncbi:MAG: glutamate synthase large subunit [Fidelibacterota bacterium]|nr:MAG: glutamate synthase large subunit [Candidatus Neomarinimicrobiota bacterium]